VPLLCKSEKLPLVACETYGVAENQRVQNQQFQIPNHHRPAINRILNLTQDLGDGAKVVVTGAGGRNDTVF